MLCSMLNRLNNSKKQLISNHAENVKVGKAPISLNFRSIGRRSSEDSNNRRHPGLSFLAFLIYGALSLGILGSCVYQKWCCFHSIGQHEIKTLISRFPFCFAKFFENKVFQHFRKYFLIPGGLSNQNLDIAGTERQTCAQTCTLEIVESIPENLTRESSEENNFKEKLVTKSTFEAWKELLELADEQLSIAAYKSSLRGKHVLATVESRSTTWGEQIFQNLLDINRERQLKIKMVENYPPKDKGDNEDGLSLSRRGVIERRPLNYYKIFGTHGAMHSKFLIADLSHFYLGSANFDWRSLNQKCEAKPLQRDSHRGKVKMRKIKVALPARNHKKKLKISLLKLEIGVLVKDCPCLASDLKSIFDDYWFFASKINHNTSNDLEESTNTVEKLIADHREGSAPVTINAKNALEISYKGTAALAYLAASPQKIGARERTFSLHAILDEINGANNFIYINVMDYVPMFLYTNPRRYWPIIDDALRRAVVERNVELKLISAALHFVPQNLYFLKSLKSLSDLGSRKNVQIKILRVPVITNFHTIIARDRRTHKKFLVTENSVIIGTSNWVGDYFHSSTGVEIVIRQNGTAKSLGPIVRDMRLIFFRDWWSDYSHDLSTYMKTCLDEDSLRKNKNDVTLDTFLRTSRMCQPIQS